MLIGSCRHGWILLIVLIGCQLVLRLLLLRIRRDRGCSGHTIDYIVLSLSLTLFLTLTLWLLMKFLLLINVNGHRRWIIG